MKESRRNDLIKHFIDKSKECFSFLVLNYGFQETAGIVDFAEKSQPLVDIHYDNIPTFFWICRNFVKDECQIEFGYGPAGQLYGTNELKLHGDYHKGKKYIFRINHLLTEAQIIEEEIQEGNVDSEKKIDNILEAYMKYIEANTDLFIGENDIILDSLLIKRKLHQQAVSKKLGYE